MPPRRPPPQPRSPSPTETFDEPSPSQSDIDDAPPVILSPIKRRNARGGAGAAIARLNDKDAWKYSDPEILDAAMVSWRSPVYDHYDISLRRGNAADGSPDALFFVFKCKFNSSKHPTLERARKKTAEGTGNLKKAMDACLQTLGPAHRPQSTAKPDTTVPAATSSYSSATHRALIALRCAKSFRPFNMVADSDYILEVLLLRPGTKIPDPSTVSRDIRQIYEKMSLHVKNYFQNIDGPVHLVLDGWTSPLIFAYLGLVIVWYANGNIHRAILEFIRLKSSHDGKYLASVVAECLKRFQLGDRLFSICMDNATNCDKLAEVLPTLLPSFPGKERRLRCVPHILNLVAKESCVFISFFFKKPRSRKRVGIAEGETSAKFGRPGESRANLGGVDEVVLDMGNTVDPDEDIAVLQEAEFDDNDDEQDEGQATHNEKVSRTIRDKAIQLMAQKHPPIRIDPDEETVAQQIFPRIAGLARQVYQSPTANEKFVELVENSENPEIRDLECLESHIYFRDIIEELTSIHSLKLSAYRLTEQQWEIASDIDEVLLLFKKPTDLFSQSEVPLVIDVIPMLETIREGLIGARDDTLIPNVVRVAAQAGILLVDKYSTFTEECPLYSISIVLCPDRKLKWFKDHGRTTQQIRDIKKLVVDTWKSRYEGPSSATGAAHQAPSRRSKRSRYEASVTKEKFPIDSIQHYLEDSLASASDILAAGGYIKYWSNLKETRPRLAKMALDYCSAPASSVDAERAFSSGRWQVNFMQHNMSSQTFKAQMAVGSWANSPLYPGLPTVTSMISKEKEVIADEGQNPFIVPSTTSSGM